VSLQPATKSIGQHVVNVHVVLIEPCPAKWSEVVHKYSQRHHHEGQFVSEYDTAPSSQLQDSSVHDDDDDDNAGSSDGTQPAAHGRYSRRYDPADTDRVVVVERTDVTDRTYSVTEHGPQLAVTSSGGGGSVMRRRAEPLSVDVQRSQPLLPLDWTTALYCLSSVVSLMRRLSGDISRS